MNFAATLMIFVVHDLEPAGDVAQGAGFRRHKVELADLTPISVSP